MKPSPDIKTGLFCLILFLCTCAPGPLLIRDVRILPQKGLPPPEGIPADAPLISDAFQRSLFKQSQSRIFSPWHTDTEKLSADPIRIRFLEFKNSPGWGENRMPRESAWVGQMEANVCFTDFPNVARLGLTTVRTNLRALPTNKPVFHDFNLPGEGYPFDYVQVSGIGVNVPVFILHATQDRSWIYVLSHIAWGWLPARDVAVLDSAEAAAWENSPKITVIEDNTPVQSIGGDFLFLASHGSFFPHMEEDSLRYIVLSAAADPAHRYVPVQAVISKNRAADSPVPLTYSHLITFVNRMIGEPYGWGGMFENRDCSATIKDLFTPFGLTLPRHSAHQAQGRYGRIELKNLPPQKKEALIVDRGIPYLSLLWLPGHIMLYIGSRDGHAQVFHNMWGIRTKSFFGKEGRKIVGQTVVTSLSPGRELADRDPDRDILHRIESMTWVIPPDSLKIYPQRLIRAEPHFAR